MNDFDAGLKIIDTELFLHHNITDLNFGKTFYCFAQSGETFTEKRHKHAHMHKQKHTFTCTHKHIQKLEVNLQS